MLWVVQDNNYEATKYYLDIIEKASVLAGQDVKQVESIKALSETNKDDFYLVATLFDAVKLYIQGKKKIIIWFQGVFSEESYMKHGNIIRKRILEKIEKFVLKKAFFLFFVSEEMKKYYTENFGIDVEKRSYIMPCFNTTLNAESFNYREKYENNVFCYAGSLSVWQGIDRILEVYKKIESISLPNTHLMMLTKHKEEAEYLITKANIKNYSIDYVPLEELPQKLAKAKYGFVIREDVIVNRVSTPTKISTYMANGIIPIFSSCLKDFSLQVEEYNYVINFDDKNFFDTLERLSTNKLAHDDVYNEFSNLFDNYFSTDRHVNKIKEHFSNLFKLGINNPEEN